MRCPSSPDQGGTSRPGSSFWNFTQLTVRPLLLPTGAVAGVGSHSAIVVAIVQLPSCNSQLPKARHPTTQPTATPNHQLRTTTNQVDIDSLPYRNLTHFYLNCRDPLQSG